MEVYCVKNVRRRTRKRIIMKLDSRDAVIHNTLFHSQHSQNENTHIHTHTHSSYIPCFHSFLCGQSMFILYFTIAIAEKVAIAFHVFFFLFCLEDFPTRKSLAQVSESERERELRMKCGRNICCVVSLMKISNKTI